MFQINADTSLLVYLKNMVIQKGVASKNTNPQCMWRSWTISLSHVVSTNINPLTPRSNV